MRLLKRLLLPLLLFSSPVLAEKYTIYTTERLPSSWSGIIHSEGCYYWFINGIPPAEKHKSYIFSQGCWIKTNEKAEIINKDIILVKNKYDEDRYFCSEEHIRAVKKTNPEITPNSLRHRYAHQCHKDSTIPISIKDAAAAMGHSVETHNSFYGSYTTELSLEEAFERHLNKRIEV